MRLTDIIEAATPGPWWIVGHGDGHQTWVYSKGIHRYYVSENTLEADATYIAAFDPALTAALVRVAEAADPLMAALIPFLRDHADAVLAGEPVRPLVDALDAYHTILRERGLEG